MVPVKNTHNSLLIIKFIQCVSVIIHVENKKKVTRLLLFCGTMPEPNVCLHTWRWIDGRGVYPAATGRWSRDTMTLAPARGIPTYICLPENVEEEEEDGRQQAGSHRPRTTTTTTATLSSSSLLLLLYRSLRRAAILLSVVLPPRHMAHIRGATSGTTYRLNRFHYHIGSKNTRNYPQRLF